MKTNKMWKWKSSCCMISEDARRALHKMSHAFTLHTCMHICFNYDSSFDQSIVKQSSISLGESLLLFIPIFRSCIRTRKRLRTKILKKKVLKRQINRRTMRYFIGPMAVFPSRYQWMIVCMRFSSYTSPCLSLSVIYVCSTMLWFALLCFQFAFTILV